MKKIILLLFIFLCFLECSIRAQSINVFAEKIQLPTKIKLNPPSKAVFVDDNERDYIVTYNLQKQTDLHIKSSDQGKLYSPHKSARYVDEGFGERSTSGFEFEAKYLIMATAKNYKFKFLEKGSDGYYTSITLGRKVTVSVSDTGLGVKSQDIEKLFDRYYRVDTNETKHISGFGIGLYLCAEIVRHHGGAIWAESERGVGSTFYFSLPLPGLNTKYPEV